MGRRGNGQNAAFTEGHRSWGADRQLPGEPTMGVIVPKQTRGLWASAKIDIVHLGSLQPSGRGHIP
jgi:hypothetical protein